MSYYGCVYVGWVRSVCEEGGGGGGGKRGMFALG